MRGGYPLSRFGGLTPPVSVSPPDVKKSHRGKAKTAKRGYGTRHQKLRKSWEPRVATGLVKCARCDVFIQPGEAWDLGHDDHDRSRYTGPEHSRCNRATAGRRVRRSRRW